MPARASIVTTTGANEMTARLTCITDNIHSGVGLDKRYDLRRIQRVLGNQQPHIVALQELDCGLSRTARDDQSAVLAQGLGAASFFCPVRSFDHGSAGIAVISPFEVLQHQPPTENSAAAVLPVWRPPMERGPRRARLSRSQPTIATVRLACAML